MAFLWERLRKSHQQESDDSLLQKAHTKLHFRNHDTKTDFKIVNHFKKFHINGKSKNQYNNSAKNQLKKNDPKNNRYSQVSQ